MKTPEAETRRALARLRRALEKARREVRGLREGLDESEADGYPADDYAEMEGHLDAVSELVNREQTRQQAKILRAGGIGPGGLRGSALRRSGSLGAGSQASRSLGTGSRGAGSRRDGSHGAGPQRSAEPVLRAEGDGEGGRRS